MQAPSLTITLTFSSGAMNITVPRKMDMYKILNELVNLRGFIVDTAAGKVHYAKDLTATTFVVNVAE